jgi:hypothetical protein
MMGFFAYPPKRYIPRFSGCLPAKDLATEIREYYIPDFTAWKDHDAFEAAFARLLRDLKDTERQPQG